MGTTVDGGWKQYAAGILGFVLRTYIRYAPGDAFKATAYEKYFKYVAWRPFVAVTRTRHGFRMMTQVADLIASTIYLTGQWEPYVSAYIRQRLRPGDIFVDVGANIGYYSLLASQLVGNTGRVYAIEASPGIYGSLLQNIELNGCRNVVALNAAAADTAGELEIWHAGDRNRGHSTTATWVAMREGMQRESTVRADTMSALVGAEPLRAARLVKIDVEGAERTVLTPLLSSAASLGNDTEWLIELTPGYSKEGQRDADWIFDSFVAIGYSAHVIPNTYDFACYNARPRTARLERLRRLPDHQVDVLFRPPG